MTHNRIWLSEVTCATEGQPDGCEDVATCEHCGDRVCREHDEVTFCAWTDTYTHAGCELDCSHCHTWGMIAAYPRE